MVNENKGTVQGRLDRAFFKKGKEFSVIQPKKTKKYEGMDLSDLDHIKELNIA